MAYRRACHPDVLATQEVEDADTADDVTAETVADSDTPSEQADEQGATDSGSEGADAPDAQPA